MKTFRTTLLDHTSPCASKRDLAALVGRTFTAEGHTAKVTRVGFSMTMDRRLVAQVTTTLTAEDGTTSTRKDAIGTAIRVDNPFAPLNPVRFSRPSRR